VSDRPEATLLTAMIDVLRPVVAELVAVEVERQVAERVPPDEPWVTASQYAQRHQTTAAAVRARCRRRTLPGAWKPPGSREWLIPNDGKQGVIAATMPSARGVTAVTPKSAPATQQRPGA
jgi:hypothetical protein